MRGEKTASGERFALSFRITALDRYPWVGWQAQ